MFSKSIYSISSKMTSLFSTSLVFLISLILPGIFNAGNSAKFACFWGQVYFSFKAFLSLIGMFWIGTFSPLFIFFLLRLTLRRLSSGHFSCNISLIYWTLMNYSWSNPGIQCFSTTAIFSASLLPIVTDIINFSRNYK